MASSIIIRLVNSGTGPKNILFTTVNLGGIPFFKDERQVLERERWWTAIGSTISVWRVSHKGPRTAWEMNALRMYSYVLQLIELRLSSIVLFDSDNSV
jgi:hypothetical protein